MDVLSRRCNEILVLSLEVDLRGRILEAFPSDTWYQEVREEIESRNTIGGRFSSYFLESNELL